jgi:class 3 adenylate cyclase
MLPQVSTEQRTKAELFGRQRLTGLVTLLFTDMVDSTALKQRLGRQSFEVFEKHHQLVRDCLARFPNAREIETAGDSFFLIFAVPSDAVEFSLILQAKLRVLFQSAGVAVQDRIGINLGEVVIREPEREHEKGGLFGIQVDNLCAGDEPGQGRADSHDAAGV